MTPRYPKPRGPCPHALMGGGNTVDAQVNPDMPCPYPNCHEHRGPECAYYGMLYSSVFVWDQVWVWLNQALPGVRSASIATSNLLSISQAPAASILS